MCNYLVDKEAQEFVKHSTKHYHKHCFEQFELGKQHRKELHEYICELYNMPVISGFILKQIKEFEENYGYKLGGMKLALKYFFEVQGNNTDSDDGKYNTQGIGIIPYVYNDARIHYQKLQRVMGTNNEIQFDNTPEIAYASPPKIKKKKLIDISGL